MIIADDIGVSRETFADLERYVSLLKVWTKKINLISKSTVPDVWSRHVMDSVQVYNAIDTTGDLWLDIGSGGGLPGLVVAILLKHDNHETKTVMIESDVRKATFLRTVVRELELNASVVTSRVETTEPVKASIISARALGPLVDLLGYADRHLDCDGLGIFSKGQSWQKEVDEAREMWRFDLDVIDSMTDPKAAILKIGGISRV